VGLILVLGAAAVGVYAYVGYPFLLWLATRRRSGRPPAEPDPWPLLSITVPAHNEEATLAATLEHILEVDYPADRRQVLVVSDASTDRTDDIARSFAARGVELVRLPRRAGKTAAENAARAHLRGEVVVQTDASVRIDRGALKALVAAFSDPAVGVASGRDLSVADAVGDNAGESGYVGYEMWVRDMETRGGGIVGASGCLYATRRALHMETVPEALSRDFAAPLIAREHGFRSVSVADAVCYVPRITSLRQEYRRKIRTMTRGLQTLFYKRPLLNPIRYGRFGFMLLSHKLIRWLVPWAALVGVTGLGVAAVGGARWGALGLIAAGAAVAAAIMAWYWPEARPLPRVLGVPAYVVWGVVAGLHAWGNALRGEVHPVWDPTRRGPSGSSP
jgi:cellulose synthase/poly-beta-1,6-N-acetylglucosamine synthase-like glycosyltransferase